MKETEKKNVANEIMSDKNSFAGYTIEEIKFQRALVAMQAEFCKTKFLKSWDNIQRANPLSQAYSKSSLPAKAGSIAMKMVNGLNYMDYVLLGISAFSGARKIFSFFHKFKKK